jgi:hypothetical protein
MFNSSFWIHSLKVMSDKRFCWICFYNCSLSVTKKTFFFVLNKIILKRKKIERVSWKRKSRVFNLPIQQNFIPKLWNPSSAQIATWYYEIKIILSPLILLQQIFLYVLILIHVLLSRSVRKPQITARTKPTRNLRSKGSTISLPSPRI